MNPFAVTQGKKPKVFVAMSGGVDSSVAAALLQKSGKFEVIGAHMKCWSEGEYCTSEQDAEDARRVAAKLNIPFYVFDFEREYRDKVFAYMVREYSAGRTPNPDVMCNSRIKFGVFLDKVLALGADYIATGHYVRLMRNFQFSLRQAQGPEQCRGAIPNFQTNSKFKIQNSKLLAAKDLNKDQSYFLWTLTQEQLKHCLFPIGDYLKSEVREMAKEFNLPTAAKKDSQGLCFVGEIKFDDFLREVLPKQEGIVVTTSGREVGKHDGLHFYTIGQRRGIGIGGGIPYYVAEKKFETNTLIVGEGPYDDGLFQNELAVSSVNWISGTAPEFPLKCEARIRYRQPLQKCRLLASSSWQLANEIKPEASSQKLVAIFKEPQRAVTSGQSAVFYKNGPAYAKASAGKEMLGGGIIM